MEEKHIAIAIDGPAAAGKSTVAKRVADKLGFTYIDTGAMYRAFTYAVIDKGLNPQNEEESISIIPETDIGFDAKGHIMCNGKDVSEIIRTPLVSGNVSYIAAMKPIRLAMIDMQRKLAKHVSVVMDGRDIGSFVLPDAEVKIFQIATPETRAQRRYLENQEKGIATTYEDVLNEVKTRDYIDSHRDFDPLMAASDSITLDTSDMNIEEVVDAILAIVKDKTGIE